MSLLGASWTSMTQDAPGPGILLLGSGKAWVTLLGSMSGIFSAYLSEKLVRKAVSCLERSFCSLVTVGMGFFVGIALAGVVVFCWEKVI